jgi:hypothetical protein
MDTLFWTQFNTDVKFGCTTKKYYGKYLYKLIVYAPAGRLIEKEWENISEALVRRREFAERRVNWGGSWWSNGAKAADADASFLELLGYIRHNHDNIRFRIEEPNISIYAESEDVLKSLVSSKFDGTQYRYIKEISGPESVEAEQHLNNGAILRRTNNDYRYKAILRDGRYEQDVKFAIYNYLKNSGETQLTAGCAEQLLKDYTYIWNVFFYTNDKDVIHFINLIAPDSITNIHELVVLPNK